MDWYSACTSKAWIVQFYLQTTLCLPVPRKRSPDGATTDYGHRHLIAAYYSFIDPKRMKGWVSLVILTLSALSAQSWDQIQDSEVKVTWSTCLLCSFLVWTQEWKVVESLFGSTFSVALITHSTTSRSVCQRSRSPGLTKIWQKCGTIITFAL